MKIALALPYFWRIYWPYAAELELFRRFIIAGQKLGIEVQSFFASPEIIAFNPDFVLSFHMLQPKMWDFPTYYCAWDPPEHFESTYHFQNLLCTDGLLYGSDTIKTFIAEFISDLEKNYLEGVIYPSTHQTEFTPPTQFSTAIPYVGNNWDGARHQDLFVALDQLNVLHTYGRIGCWDYLPNSYKGEIPKDGESLLKIYAQYGVGLCLHKDVHLNSGTPSMRAFEIIAACALPICDPHPFIMNHFKDTVLYIDYSLTAEAKALQIKDYLAWIQAHPKQACEMIEAAHQIFSTQFTAEQMLKNAMETHTHYIQMIGAEKSLIQNTTNPPSIEIIVRTNGLLISQYLERALNTIAMQNYPNLTVHIAYCGKNWPEFEANSDTLFKKFPTLKIKIQDYSPFTHDSTQLFQALQNTTEQYIGFLDEQDILYKRHLYALSELLNNHPEAILSFCPGIKTTEIVTNDGNFNWIHPTETTDSHQIFVNDEFFETLPALEAEKQIKLNSFLIRKTSIEKLDIADFPPLNSFEDYLLYVALKKQITESAEQALCDWQVTCAFTQEAIFTPFEKIQADYAHWQSLTQPLPEGVIRL